MAIAMLAEWIIDVSFCFGQQTHLPHFLFTRGNVSILLTFEGKNRPDFLLFKSSSHTLNIVHGFRLHELPYDVLSGKGVD